jgi:4-hydroxy-2-oxoheptanedioate aldolase
MMKKNFVREKLKKGECSMGTWLTLASPTAAHLMANVGFDWLTVEMEHSPTDLGTAAECFPIILSGNCAPFVRVPFNTTENIKRVLDTGAWGVIVPMVNTKAEAQAVIDAARYAPIGKRTIGGQIHGAMFGCDSATYYKKANDEVLVVLMAEHVDAVENADEIMSIPGIDCVFIGPNDLSNSMGLPPVFESDDKRFVEAVDHIFKTAKKHGIAPGIHVADWPTAARRREQGWQFIAISSETGFMLSKATEVARKLGLGTDRPLLAKY